MKLIIWNKANSCSPATYAQRRTIRVNRHGYIYLSGALTAEMELRDGCRLNLANDEQNPKDWYLCRTQHEEGFRLRGDRPGKKRRDEAADRRRGVLERMSGLEAPRAGKSGMFLRALPRRKRTRRGRRCEILQNSYRQPDSRHAQKRREEMTARQGTLPSASVFLTRRIIVFGHFFLPAIFVPGQRCSVENMVLLQRHIPES